MNIPNGEPVSQPQVAVIRDGLLDRLRAQSGVKSDEAFARLIGVSRPTLQRLRNGEEPTLRSAVGIAQAFGLGLGEVVEMRTVDVAELQVAS
jgi:transcriptional regulator with XRE-family HTH domain